MAGQELESKTIELKTSTLESVTFSLMARDTLDRLPLPLDFKTGDKDIFIKLESDVLLKANPSEPYEKGVVIPLFDKLMTAGLLMASLREVENQASLPVDLTGKEMDYLNELYLGRMRRRQEIEDPRVKEIMDIIDEVRGPRINIFEESREIFMELNLLWNKSGGIPRPAFLEFSGDKDLTK